MRRRLDGKAPPRPRRRALAAPEWCACRAMLRARRGLCASRRSRPARPRRRRRLLYSRRAMWLPEHVTWPHGRVRPRASHHLRRRGGPRRRLFLPRWAREEVAALQTAARGGVRRPLSLRQLRQRQVGDRWQRVAAAAWSSVAVVAVAGTTWLACTPSQDAARQSSLPIWRRQSELVWRPTGCNSRRRCRRASECIRS